MRKKTAVNRFKIHHISCETSNNTSVSGSDRICGVFFGPPEAGMGGGAGRWSGAHTQRFSFLLRFLGLQTSDFLMFYIIRFVFPLAFQCRIRNCSTAKTREDMAKRKRKVENDGSAFLNFLDSFKHISRFLGL